MAYIEIRPLVNTDGEEEFDLCAYSDQEAKEIFGDELSERINKDPERGECTLRRVDWSDEKVEAFNEKVREFNALIWDVLVECGFV